MAEDFSDGYSVEKGYTYVKGKRGGKKGNKGNKSKNRSKSVLEGGATRKSDHICFGPKCESKATKIVSLGDASSLVPLCPSCARKASVRADRRNLPAPQITSMTRQTSEWFKQSEEGATEQRSPRTDAVEKFIKEHRAGSAEIYGYGETKVKKHHSGKRYTSHGTPSSSKSGNPKGKTKVHRFMSEQRNRDEAAKLTYRAIRGEFESLKPQKPFTNE